MSSSPEILSIVILGLLVFAAGMGAIWVFDRIDQWVRKQMKSQEGDSE